MTAVISDFSRVDDAWRKLVARRLLEPGRESPYIMDVRLDGVGALAGLFEVFLVVSDYIFIANHVRLSHNLFVNFEFLFSHRRRVDDSEPCH